MSFGCLLGVFGISFGYLFDVFGMCLECLLDSSKILDGHKKCQELGFKTDCGEQIQRERER